MKKMKLKNSFHNTEITILVPDGIHSEKEAWIWVQSCAERSKVNGSSNPAKRLLRRVTRKLCPNHTECKCGVVEIMDW
jgi:hypothetical protein